MNECVRNGRVHCWPGAMCAGAFDVAARVDAAPRAERHSEKCWHRARAVIREVQKGLPCRCASSCLLMKSRGVRTRSQSAILSHRMPALVLRQSSGFAFSGWATILLLLEHNLAVLSRNEQARPGFMIFSVSVSIGSLCDSTAAVGLP